MVYDPIKYRAYYLANRELMREKSRLWRQNNPEKRRAQKHSAASRAASLRYYYRHRDTINDNAKRWQKKHADLNKANGKHYYEQCKLANPNFNKERVQRYKERMDAYGKEYRERIRQLRSQDPIFDQVLRKKRNHYLKLWRTSNLEQTRLKGRRDAAIRKALKLAVGGSFTCDDIKRINIKQKGKCYWCKKPYERFEIDHIWPLAKGGSNSPNNLCLACPSCNRRKHSKTPIEFAGRLF